MKQLRVSRGVESKIVNRKSKMAAAKGGWA